VNGCAGGDNGLMAEPSATVPAAMAAPPVLEEIGAPIREIEAPAPVPAEAPRPAQDPVPG